MMRLRADAMLVALAFATLAMPARAADRALVLEIDGAIGPPIADYVVKELQAAKPETAGLIILRMNTPGGLDSSMRQIVSAILASPVPVATYVAPSGARAASAGTYIAYASAIAAMAPGTNIGAATPVQLGGIPLLPRGSKRTKTARQERRTGGYGDPQDRQRRRRLYSQPCRAQRPQCRLGRRGRAFRRKPSSLRGAGATRHRRDRRRQRRSAVPRSMDVW